MSKTDGNKVKYLLTRVKGRKKHTYTTFKRLSIAGLKIINKKKQSDLRENEKPNVIIYPNSCL